MFLFNIFQNYKLQPSALHALKIPENSKDEVWMGAFEN